MISLSLFLTEEPKGRRRIWLRNLHYAAAALTVIVAVYLAHAFWQRGERVLAMLQVLLIGPTLHSLERARHYSRPYDPSSKVNHS